MNKTAGLHNTEQYAGETQCGGIAKGSGQIENLTLFAGDNLSEQLRALRRLNDLRDRLLGTRPECGEKDAEVPVNGQLSELANVLDASRTATAQLHYLIDELSEL